MCRNHNGVSILCQQQEWLGFVSERVRPEVAGGESRRWRVRSSDGFTRVKIFTIARLRGEAIRRRLWPGASSRPDIVLPLGLRLSKSLGDAADMKLKNSFWLGQTAGETMATFGAARLVKKLNGKIELIGGTTDDLADAREWCRMFMPEMGFNFESTAIRPSRQAIRLESQGLPACASAPNA